MNKLSLFFICGGTITLGLTLSLCWTGLPLIIRDHIRKNARFIRGRGTYKNWKHPTYPIYRKFWFFNVTNGEDVANGGKPILTEVGPYTYKEHLKKVDIEIGFQNNSLQYRNQRGFQFQAHLSKGTEDDWISLVNIPLLTVSKLTNSSEDDLNGKLTEGSASLFSLVKVKEALFQGVNIDTYLDILQVLESNETQIPEKFMDGKYAIFKELNGTETGTFEINTGERNFSDFARIVAVNNNTELTWWRDEPCNKLNGTDGNFFSPFLTPESKLEIYSVEMCRSQTFMHDENILYKNVPAYRFKVQSKVLQSSAHNAENWCYCKMEDQHACDKDGVLDISGCSEGLPLVISAPHFLDGDPSLVQAVEGLEPNPQIHTSHFIVEPATGKLLEASYMHQLNVELQPSSHINLLSKVPHLILPVVWTERSMNIKEDQMKIFGRYKAVKLFVEDSRQYIAAGSIGILIVGIFIALISKDKSEQRIIK